MTSPSASCYSHCRAVRSGKRCSANLCIKTGKSHLWTDVECSLTLTVASRAYLLEPHWYVSDETIIRTSTLTRSRNPTLEEQALARIHRLGQTQEVTTVRLYVRDSFEEVSDAVGRHKQGRANSRDLVRQRGSKVQAGTCQCPPVVSRRWTSRH